MQEVEKTDNYNHDNSAWHGKGPAFGSKYRGTLRGKDYLAFKYYFRHRNYSEVAKKFGVCLMSVTKHAKKFGWTKRIEELEVKVKEKVDFDIATEIAKDNVLMYKTFSLGNKKVIEELNQPNVSSFELNNLMNAMDKVVKNKKLIAGEPTESHQITFKDLMKKVNDRLEKHREETANDVIVDTSTVEDQP